MSRRATATPTPTETQEGNRPVTSTITAPLIPHAASCKRPAPVLRSSWRGQPEAFCPGCGRAALLPIPDGPTEAPDPDDTEGRNS